MQRDKHKRKKNHVVIVTSDAADADVKQFHIRPWMLQLVILILCIVIGAMIGYIIHEEQIWETINQNNQIQKEAMQKQLEEVQEQKQTLTEEMQALQEEKESLETQIVDLNDKIRILSDTVNEKVQQEQLLAEQLQMQSTPTEFPLTGSASIEEMAEDKLMCVFTASVGTTVVAAASGTVTAVNEEEEYGHNVWIDHGNGYITVYHNKGDAIVKQGDSVVQGTTLFLIGEDNTKLGYQMLKDGTYINPMELLSISG